MPNFFMFCEGRKQAMTKFIFFTYLDMVDRNSAPEEFACMIAFDKVSELDRNWKKVNSFFHATIDWRFDAKGYAVVLFYYNLG